MTFRSTTIANETTDKVGISGWVERHQLLAAYSITFLLAWGPMLAILAGLRGRLPSPLVLIFALLVGWAPAIAAVVVSAITGGRAEVGRLLGRFLIWQVRFHWYLVAFFLMGLIILGGIGLHVLFGGKMPFLPFTASTSVSMVVTTFMGMMMIGPLVNTEEVLWRGFAFPRLQLRYGWLLGSLLLAIPEILLHLPYFFDPDSLFYRTVGIFWFSAFSFAAVILYTWVFNHTKGSLIMVTLLHASQNAWSTIFSDNSLRPFQFTVLVMWVIAVLLIVISVTSSRSRKSNATKNEQMVGADQ
jgi:membrane protease YdiL (CAAX protease family)